MTVFLEVTINNSLRRTLLETVKKDWDVSGEASTKKELIQLLNGSLQGFDPYVKIYLFQIDGRLIGISGSKPTKTASSSLSGILSYVNAIKRDPSKIHKYVNEVENFLSGDDLVNSKLEQIKKGELATDDFCIVDRDEPAPAVVQQEPAANSSPENSSEEIETLNSCNNVSAAPFDSKSGGLGKLLKIETFDEENMSAADWLLNASYTLDIAGVRDPKIYLSGIMSKLPENLLGKTRAELSRREITPEKLTFEELKNVLCELTKKSPLEYERKLSNLKFASGMKMRDFWIKIERLVKLLNPTVTDTQSLNTIITREFKSKMPNHIRKNVSFKACTDTDISIAEMAETVQECQSGQVESNNFQKSKNGSGKGRWSGKRGGHQGPQRNFEKNQNGKSEKANNKKNYRCYFCGKYGHLMSDCYQFKARKEEFKNDGGRGTKNTKKDD